jgi:hypothetical protein
MGSQMEIEGKIKEILGLIESPNSSHGDIDTCTAVYNLALKSQWEEAEYESIAFLATRLDISKKIYLGYKRNGRKAVGTELADREWLELFVAILLKSALLAERNSSVEIALKRFNTLYKMLDILSPPWLSSGAELAVAMESAYSSLLAVLPVAPESPEVAGSTFTRGREGEGLKVIPLTVLFYEGPIARAYLETISSLGLRPQKIVELVAAKDVSTKKTVGKWMPKGLRKSYAASIQRSKIHYWPNQLLKDEAVFIEGLLAEIESSLGFSRPILDNANSLRPLSTYSDCVEPLLVDSLTDRELHGFLSAEKKGAVLFTGGGIVPADLLNIQHLKFLHIHPGYLPNIRGADCALWSTLLTGYTSATCFYMSPGIDTGDIIEPRWLPKLAFEVPKKGQDLLSAYRAVYGFIDPWVRAYVLREVLVNNEQFDNLESRPQADQDGTTFHFMHDKLREIALERLLALEVGKL